MKKIWVIIICSLAIIVSAGSGTYYYFHKKINKDQNKSQDQTDGLNAESTNSQSDLTASVATSAETMSAATIISLLRNDIQNDTLLSSAVIPSQRENPDAIWIGQDGWAISVPNPERITLFAGQTKNGSSTVSIDINKYAATLDSVFSDRAKRESFAKDALNVSYTVPDFRNVSLSSFSNGSVYCSEYNFSKDGITTFTDQDGGTVYGARADIWCINKSDYDKWHDTEIPLLQVLGDNFIAITNVKIKNNLARMNEIAVRGIGSGVTSMYYDGGTWKVIERGAQGISICQDFIDKHIPSQFWLTCADSHENTPSNIIHPAGSAWKDF